MLAVPFDEAVPRHQLHSTPGSRWCRASPPPAPRVFDTPGRLPASVHLWRAWSAGWAGSSSVVAALAILAPLNLGGFEVISGGAGAARRRAARSPASPTPRSVSCAMRCAGAGLRRADAGALGRAADRRRRAAGGADATRCRRCATSGISPVGGMSGARSGIPGEMLIFIFLFFALSRRHSARHRPGRGPQAPGPRPRVPHGADDHGRGHRACCSCATGPRRSRSAAAEHLSAALRALWGERLHGAVVPHPPPASRRSAGSDAQTWSGLEHAGADPDRAGADRRRGGDDRGRGEAAAGLRALQARPARDGEARPSQFGRRGRACWRGACAARAPMSPGSSSCCSRLSITAGDGAAHPDGLEFEPALVFSVVGAVHHRAAGRRSPPRRRSATPRWPRRPRRSWRGDGAGAAGNAGDHRASRLPISGATEAAVPAGLSADRSVTDCSLGWNLREFRSILGPRHDRAQADGPKQRSANE